jgi:hypothetical protein
MTMDPKLEAALSDLTNRVMGRAGVVGTAIGERCGKPCLKVYVAEAKARRNIPRSIGGFRVVVEETGSFRRL